MTQHQHSSSSPATCPVLHASDGTTVSDWWPERLDLSKLHRAHPAADPLGDEFDYRAAVQELDIDAVKADIVTALRSSQPWWPADWGHYGPFIIRLAWHAAGTYRTSDGRGGARQGLIRFAPQNSWPDNTNLDKARRLLWPVKQKYGRSLSWADLMVLAGNVALEDMGFQTHGFALGREDVWEIDDTYWGNERAWLADTRHDEHGELSQPLAAVQMGLIYVNPEGPNGNPDPLASARDIRETFARMGMNDEETVALIAGGHTFGKAHGAAAASNVGVEPEGAPLHQQGFGWKNAHGTGHGADTITSGLEGAWTQHPTRWDNEYFENLFQHEWELTESPAGAKQWRPVTDIATVPDAHLESVEHLPMMLTSDLALRVDPVYEEISRRFWQNPDELRVAFAKAWYKLTHRDMGPHHLLVGPEVPAQPEIWQDPVPAVDHELIDREDVRALKQRVLELAAERAIDHVRLVAAAWAAASTFRHTDLRGGTNGGRIRLLPQREWEENDPEGLALTIQLIEDLQAEFNHRASTAGSQKRVSFADLVVIAGNAALEHAAARAGHDVTVPFSPGRTDADQEHTDVAAFEVLRSTFDPFRNHLAAGETHPAEALMVERAALLSLSAPELVVLLSGMRALGISSNESFHGHRPGVFSETPGSLDNGFLAELLSMDTVWEPADEQHRLFIGRDRATHAPRHVASRVDLAIGSHSQLRAIAEVFAAADGAERFVAAFVAAWAKVMHLGM